MISKITNNLENFSYNVIIANIYETYNFLNKEIENDINKEDLVKCYNNILKIMSPIIPHFTAECMTELKTNYQEEYSCCKKY